MEEQREREKKKEEDEKREAEEEMAKRVAEQVKNSLAATRSPFECNLM